MPTRKIVSFYVYSFIVGLDTFATINAVFNIEILSLNTSETKRSCVYVLW